MSSTPMTSRRQIPTASYWKLASVGDLRRDPMTTIDPDARLAAALSFARHCRLLRKFAEEAGNPMVLEAHLRFVAKCDKEAAALEAASN
jgi:hypothetical protein